MNKRQFNELPRVEVTDDLLNKITHKIVEHFHPSKIILFGSRAERRAQKESDIDLLVIMESTIDPKIKFDVASKLSREVGLNIHLMPMVGDTYEETKDVMGGIAFPATKYGIVIYEKP